MTQNEILAAVVESIRFGMIECNVRVPADLREHFSDMLPYSRMRWLLSLDVIEATEYYLYRRCCDGTSPTGLPSIMSTKSSSTKRIPASNAWGPYPEPTGDADPDKTIIGYGKTVTNIDRHRNFQYCTKAGTSSLINNKRFRQLEVVTDNAYEIEMSKGVVTYKLPSISMRNSACCSSTTISSTLYVERPLFQYCEMDTDSAYIELAGESIDELVVDHEN